MKRPNLSVRMMIVLTILLLNVIVSALGLFISSSWYWTMIITFPILLLALLDALQTRHAIIRNFPVEAHLHYLIESIRH